MNTMEVKANEGLRLSFLGWYPCQSEIVSYENCKRNGKITMTDPAECYNQAKALQNCYSQKAYLWWVM